jgi:RNA polymerase sigma-B factor
VIVLRKALTALSSRDLLILQRRFFEDRTQQQIGQEIGLSQMQVSRVQARILRQLRALIEPTEAA